MILSRSVIATWMCEVCGDLYKDDQQLCCNEALIHVRISTTVEPIEDDLEYKAEVYAKVTGSVGATVTEVATDGTTREGSWSRDDQPPMSLAELLP